jgi:nitrate/nitrite transport system substrate-binding protein
MIVRAIVEATAFASKAENRKDIAETIASPNYLNQPPIVVEQALTGTYADGLGSIRKDAKRVDFDPFPWQSFAVWMLTQMKRWGQIKGDVDYQTIAEQMFLATDTAELMRDMGLTPPVNTSKTFVVMGKIFDPSKADDYVKSFSIKRS